MQRHVMVWAKVSEPGLCETLLGIGRDCRFTARLSESGLAAAFSHDLAQNRGFHHKTLCLPATLDAFHGMSDADMPPGEMLEFGGHLNEAILETADGTASIRQADGATILKVSVANEAHVLEMATPFTLADRRQAMLGMLPRLLRMADQGFEAPVQTRCMGVVRRLFTEKGEVAASPPDGDSWFGEQVVGLTAQGWVAFWSAEYRSVMTNFTTPEEYGLHFLSSLRECGFIGLRGEEALAAIRIYYGREPDVHGKRRKVTFAEIRNASPDSRLADWATQPVP